jgi:ABC-type Fe3+/spermidine/putrescine transport system ATPase subunit
MPLKAGRHDMNLTLNNVDLTLGEFHLNCSLDLPSGKLITLLGPSGCGKTSLLKSIAGLYPLDQGTVLLGDRNITEMDPRFRRVGMVFQDYALFPHMNVEKNICYGMNLKGEDARRRSNELLELVELSGFGRRTIEELSGGEKQRVALARALATEPDLLLLDEPLSALDARLRKILRRQIREIQIKTGITTLYVTHDQEEAMALSDLVVLMNEGQVSQIGTPREIYRAPANVFAGEFFGSANIIPLSEGSSILGEINLAKISCTTENLGEASLFFRPEDCRVLLQGDSQNEDDLCCRGDVVYREFGGDFQYMEVNCGPHLIKIKTKATIEFQDREEVRWTIPVRDCLILG